MRPIRGVVIDTKPGAVRIQMETGFRFWTASDTLKIQQRVLVSWDYTVDYPNVVSTKQECIARRVAKAIVEVFSEPVNDGAPMPDISIYDFDMARFSRGPLTEEDGVDEDGSLIRCLNYNP